MNTQITNMQKDCRFFYKNRVYFCAVKIPFGVKPTCYMCMDSDNRPFETIVKEIELALELLIDEYRHYGYAYEMAIAQALPDLLGYRRTTAKLA